jgi:hypothetical protein
MARKPRSQWSPAYRRRVERAEAKGKSRQQARGHKRKEHAARKERETAKSVKLGSLTTGQKTKIKRFAISQAKKADGGASWSTYYSGMLHYTQTHGFKNFEKLVSKQRKLNEQYRGEQKRGRYATRGEEFLDTLIDKLEEPAAEVGWLYYH